MKNDKKTIFGWCMYDWANSAYITTVIAAILPNYFAKAIVGEAGVDILGMNMTATTLWGYMLGTAAFCVFLFAPVLGAIADFSSAKKRFLIGFAYMGSLFATLLYFSKSGDVGLTVVLFLGSQICFVGGNVFYDAFLPQIASEDKMDSVSARGYAFGYVGGSLQFAIALALVAMQKTPEDQAMAARIGMAMTGAWWAGWTLLTMKYLKEEKTPYQLPEAYRNRPKTLAYLSLGISRTILTAKKVGRFKHLTLFLVAYMIYNDGIHTVTSMATIYGTEELGLSTTALMVTLLLVQVVAIGGALIFSRLAGRIGAKRSVMFALVLWSGVVTYGYFIHTATEFFVLGMIVGIVLGGTQALSRSLYGAMIPENASAEFYGFYSVFSKFSSIWGPVTFGVIKQITGSARLSIISLMVFFIVGLILLGFVDEEKAKADKLAFQFSDT
ncbi:MFS transporter [Candidatus Poribacteria bacterium]|nr:MFS transporter [Candidatus Poribacteria bacterium]MYK18501.1 MFS transporter [Candidatus Poribacteria bacterium]